MTDHPILIPTSKGPVGAIVSEPEGSAQAALIFFQGGGPPARSGVNAVWTRIAHELCELGLVVLRFDFACEAESSIVGAEAPRGPAWRSNVDMPVTREVSAWFCERVDSEVMVAGTCYGARLGLELAAEEPRVNGTFLVTPYLAGVRRGKAAVGPQVAIGVSADQSPPANAKLSAFTLDSATKIVERSSRLWILIGERDDRLALDLEQAIGEPGSDFLEVEIAPGVALHPGTDPVAQDTLATRMVERVSRALQATKPVGRPAGQ